MASGIKSAANRPKSAKHLKTSQRKKFRNESEEAKAQYRKKLSDRAARKSKKRSKR